uniref:Uncharacterized protein n=1 Tax=Syphacia muris TaxID=451379 RepID=A0A0N5ASL3_9BILA
MRSTVMFAYYITEREEELNEVIKAVITISYNHHHHHHRQVKDSETLNDSMTLYASISAVSPQIDSWIESALLQLMLMQLSDCFDVDVANFRPVSPPSSSSFFFTPSPSVFF